MPAQSRDATARTIPSRFFVPTPNPNGTILVPSSSPLSAASVAGQNNPTLYNGSVPSPPLTGTSTAFGRDPLSVPSGFTNGNKHTDASPPSITGLIRPRGEDDVSDTPPRKRSRPPILEGSPEVFSIPDSPIVQKPGQRRGPVATRIANLSISSDESILDANTNSSRIVRGARPPDSNVAETVDDGPAFLPFRISFPQFEDRKVRAAWRQAGRDVRVATSLLLDPSFSYQPSPSPAPKAPSPVVSPTTGRIKELEDARQAERAAAKEKGKKSLIYAARTNLANRNSTPPPAQQTTEDMSQQSPISPIVSIRRLKRPKVIAESDDEEQSKSESDEGSSRSMQRAEKVSSDERRALSYFNSTSAEGLQELTGSFYSTFDVIVEFTVVQDARQNKLRQSLSYGRLIQSMISKRNSVSKARKSGARQKVSARACSMIAWRSFADMVLWMMYLRNANASAGNLMPSLHRGPKTHGRARKRLVAIL